MIFVEKGCSNSEILRMRRKGFFKGGPRFRGRFDAIDQRQGLGTSALPLNATDGGFFLRRIIFTLCFCVLISQRLSAEETTPNLYGAPLKKEEAPAVTPSAIPKQAPQRKPQTVVLPLNEDEKSPHKKSYQVQRGDTLWKISRETGVSLQEIKRLNGLKSDLIRVGDILVLEENPLEIRRATLAPHEVEEPVYTPSDLNPPRVEEIKTLPPPIPLPPPAVAEKPKTPSPTAVTPPSPQVVSLKDRFLTEIRKMIADRVHYNESWRPEGSDRNWVMDCSNTTRFLFYKLFRIDIGRTASEQYYRLKIKGRAWHVPLDASGRPDVDYLHANLKIGDLLFWEHTYSPEREPPITHVTVYLGVDENGRFLMAGSEQGRGILDQGFNGPDMYYFNPLAEKGGHHQFLFFGWKPGRFVAHGRPLPETVTQPGSK
jgi:LysM repeat protein